MFDCHAHLTDSSLREGIDVILTEAEAAGVTGIVTVSESIDDAAQVRGAKPANFFDMLICTIQGAAVSTTTYSTSSSSTAY